MDARDPSLETTDYAGVSGFLRTSVSTQKRTAAGSQFLSPSRADQGAQRVRGHWMLNRDLPLEGSIREYQVVKQVYDSLPQAGNCAA